MRKAERACKSGENGKEIKPDDWTAMRETTAGMIKTPNIVEEWKGMERNGRKRKRKDKET